MSQHNPTGRLRLSAELGEVGSMLHRVLDGQHQSILQHWCSTSSQLPLAEWRQRRYVEPAKHLHRARQHLTVTVHMQWAVVCHRPPVLSSVALSVSTEFNHEFTGIASRLNHSHRGVEAIVRSPTNMAAAEIAAVDFNKMTSKWRHSTGLLAAIACGLVRWERSASQSTASNASAVLTGCKKSREYLICLSPQQSHVYTLLE